MKHLTKGLIACILSFGLIAMVKDQICFIYNPTDSLPYHYFLELRQIQPQKGHYTCVESPWYGGKVIKQIVGQAGDEITYDNNGSLWVGDQLVGKQQRQAKDGRPLTPLKTGTIPEGLVFLKGFHERSFDSRYEELGLAPVNALQGRLVVLV